MAAKKKYSYLVTYTYTEYKTVRIQADSKEEMQDILRNKYNAKAKVSRVTRVALD